MTKREQVLSLRKEGKTLREIMTIMGYKSTSAVQSYLDQARYRRVWLTEDQIVLLESILIQIRPTTEFNAEALHDIQEAIKLARGIKR